jgi:hypothetical protein
MKKLLLAFGILFSVSTFAQKAITIALDSPAVDQTIYKNQEFEVKATVTNSGTVTLTPTDTIYIILTIGGQQATPILSVTHPDIAMGASTSVAFMYQGFSANGNGTVSICIAGALSPDGTGAVQGCNTVNYINNSVGLKELAAVSSLKMYPNPAVDVLNITFDYPETTHLAVVDVTGRTVRTMDIEAGDAKVNVSDMVQGIYLYNITNTNGQVIKTGKFSVNR